MKKQFITLLFAFIPMIAIAQTGTIRGKVIDKTSGEELVGASVLIEGTSNGNTADLDGNYSIKVDPGTYTLRVTYVSYQTLILNDVLVKGGEVTIMNVALNPEDVALEEVVVVAEAIKKTENALLTVQKRASLVMDGLSAEQFSRSGDSDAAAAMKRVTGISVEGGKYVYVRGLGDRYSKTSVNKAQIPGLDPNKNTVQMDLFPSNLIDNIVVYKTFSPELPGSFSGGYVDISTKDFPQQFTMQFSGSFGYNTQTSFNEEFLTQDLESNYFLATKPKGLQLPGVLEQEVVDVGSAYPSDRNARLLDEQTKSLNTDFTPENKIPFLNNNFSFSLGNQLEVFGRQLGIIGGLSYQRSYQFYGNGTTGRFILPGTIEESNLDTTYYFNDRKGTESVLWGGLLNTAYKLNNYHKLRLNLMRNQSADITTRYSEGLFPYALGNDPNRQIQLRAQENQIRTLTSGQFGGEHRFGGSQGLRAEWLGSYTLSTQNEPDLRYFNNMREIVRGDTIYNANSSNIPPPSHYFRDMVEVNKEAKVDFELPVKVLNSLGSKLKFGGAYLSRNREFKENIFQYKVESGTQRFAGDPDQYLSENNLGLTGKNGARNIFGLIILNQTINGSYNGEEELPAAYLMLDWHISEKLKMSAGARYEGTNIRVANESESLPDSLKYAHVQGHDILPALNLTRELQENMNLRFGYGRTIARPNFRELAQFATFDFLGDFLLLGNPYLERTLIDNIDLRWEFYPRPSEYLSVSAFYKNFQNPIERAVNPMTNDIAIELNYRNVPRAYVYGLEFELRKDLAFIGSAFSNFKVGSNVSVLYSRVDITEGELKLIRTNDPGAPSTRPLYGQAPYIVNSYLGYHNPDNRSSATLSYNVSGPRLAIVGIGGTPNVYEQPRPILDFNIRKGFGDHWAIKASASNLLDSEFLMTQEFKDTDYTYQSYRTGRTFSLSFSYLIE